MKEEEEGGRGREGERRLREDGKGRREVGAVRNLIASYLLL